MSRIRWPPARNVSHKTLCSDRLTRPPASWRRGCLLHQHPGPPPVTITFSRPRASRISFVIKPGEFTCFIIKPRQILPSGFWSVRLPLVCRGWNPRAAANRTLVVCDAVFSSSIHLWYSTASMFAPDGPQFVAAQIEIENLVKPPTYRGGCGLGVLHTSAVVLSLGRRAESCWTALFR